LERRICLVGEKSSMAKKEKNYFKPNVVMSIHGILSNGKWQEILNTSLQKFGLKSLEYKYGFTVFPWLNNKRARKFKDWYLSEVKDLKNGLKINEPFHRPSIVAHSLGTLILVKALKKYPELKFDKIFLFGSIVPKNFDWYKLILNGQVNKVVLEKTKNDSVIKWSVFLTGSFNPSSRSGFLQESSYIKYECLDDFGHSDFQYEERFNEQFEKHLFDTPIQLLVKHGRNLNLSKLKEYFKKTHLIDNYNYGLEYSNNPISLERALDWAKIEPNIWSFLVDSYTDKVLGYINVLALSDNTHELFVKGKIDESEITANHVCNYDSNAKLNLVIMSIALHKDIMEKQGGINYTKPGELLTSTLSRKILEITNNGKKINNLTCVAWTPIGENLCKSFGLNLTTDTYKGLPIYSSTLKEIRNCKSDQIRPLFKWWLKKIRR
jgi:pimeloyl-ACP methyl ester carboxylesterase